MDSEEGEVDVVGVSLPHFFGVGDVLVEKVGNGRFALSCWHGERLRKGDVQCTG